MARVDRALEGLDAAALHRDFYWDLEHAPAILADTLPALCGRGAARGGGLDARDLRCRGRAAAAGAAQRADPRRRQRVQPARRRGRRAHHGRPGGDGRARPRRHGVEPDRLRPSDRRGLRDRAPRGGPARRRARRRRRLPRRPPAQRGRARRPLPAGVPAAVPERVHRVGPAAARSGQPLPRRRARAGSAACSRRRSGRRRGSPAPPCARRAACRASRGAPRCARGSRTRRAPSSRRPRAGPGSTEAPAPRSPRRRRWTGRWACTTSRATVPSARTAATIHLGADLFAPRARRCSRRSTPPSPRSRGDTAVLAHTTPYGDVWTVCAGSRRIVADAALGRALRRRGAARAARHGRPCTSSSRSSLLGAGLPAFVPVERRAAWSAICPDPGPSWACRRSAPAGARSRRRSAGAGRLISPSLSISYGEPLKMVRGEGVYLIDDTGRRHLDCVNNVAHVGHSNPRVVAALSCAGRGAQHQRPLPARPPRGLRAGA